MVPGFVYDYLSSGCNDDLAVENNQKSLDQVYLQPYYLRPYGPVQLSVEILGRGYSAPFGVAPLGLSGLIWPKASEYQGSG